jgi:hypothetical protein
MLSAIWIVILCRPRGSSASSTNTPDGVGLACASIRLVMSIPRNPYLTRSVLTSIFALVAARNLIRILTGDLTALVMSGSSILIVGAPDRVGAGAACP